MRTSNGRVAAARCSILLLTATLVAASSSTLLAQQRGSATPAPYTTWRTYGGGGHSSQYSALDQINKSNVTQLQVAWSFPVGERSFVFNPIVVDDVMYVLARDNEIVALDAATGRELWAHPHEGPVDGARHQLLAERGRQRSAPALSQRRHADGVERAHGRNRRDIRQGRPRRLARRPRVRTAGTSPTVRPLHTSNPGRVIRQPHDRVAAGARRGLRIDAGRRAGVRRRHRQARVGVPQHSARRRVRLRHLAERHAARPPAACTTGASSPSTRPTASCSCRSARRATTFSAAIAPATICTRTRSSRSTRAPANGCGISSSCITTCGTTTCRKRRSC